jgi:hypothetical protein
MLRKVGVPLMLLSLGVFSTTMFSGACSSSSTNNTDAASGGSGGKGGSGGGGAGGAHDGGTAGTGGGAGAGGAGGAHDGGTGGTGGGAGAGGAGGAHDGGTGGTDGGAGAGGAGGAHDGGTGGATDASTDGTGGAADASTDGNNVTTFQVTMINAAMAGTDAGTTGMGMATVTLDRVTGLATVTGTFSGISGSGATSAHIHDSAVTGGSNIVLPLTVPTNPAATSGNITGSGTVATNPTTLRTTAQIVTDILGGMGYINIHSTAFPAGEIRGNIPAAP